MSTVAEIEQAITKLTREEFAAFERWFESQRDKTWDEQLEADSAAGLLDFLEAEATTAAAKGNILPGCGDGVDGAKSRITAVLNPDGHLILPPEINAAAQKRAEREFDVMISTSGVIILQPKRKPERSRVDSFAALRGLTIEPALIRSLGIHPNEPR